MTYLIIVVKSTPLDRIVQNTGTVRETFQKYFSIKHDWWKITNYFITFSLEYSNPSFGSLPGSIWVYLLHIFERSWCRHTFKKIVIFSKHSAPLIFDFFVLFVLFLDLIFSILRKNRTDISFLGQNIYNSLEILTKGMKILRCYQKIKWHQKIILDKIK